MNVHVHCGPEPRFKIGDRVKVVRIVDDITSHDLIGFIGNVTEVESLAPLGWCSCGENLGDTMQHNYDVDGRYLNEQMIELACDG